MCYALRRQGKKGELPHHCTAPEQWWKQRIIALLQSTSSGFAYGSDAGQ